MVGEPVSNPACSFTITIGVNVPIGQPRSHHDRVMDTSVSKLLALKGDERDLLFSVHGLFETEPIPASQVGISKKWSMEKTLQTLYSAYRKIGIHWYRVPCVRCGEPAEGDDHQIKYCSKRCRDATNMKQYQERKRRYCRQVITRMDTRRATKT
jgi:predicted nucleic acid-binding Zn ribbon protein